MKRITNKRVFSKQVHADAQKYEARQKKKTDRAQRVMSRKSRSAPELSVGQLKSHDRPDAPASSAPASTQPPNLVGWADYDTRSDVLNRLKVLDDKERVDTRLIMKIAQCEKSTALDILVELRLIGAIKTYSSYYIITPECKTRIADYQTRHMKRPQSPTDAEREASEREIERLAAMPDDDEQPAKSLTKAELKAKREQDDFEDQQERMQQRMMYASGSKPNPRTFKRIYTPEELGIKPRK